MSGHSKADPATQQVRCTGPVQGRQCNQLLGYVQGENFRLEIKCKRCSYVNVYRRGNVPLDVPGKRPRPLRHQFRK